MPLRPGVSGRARSPLPPRRPTERNRLGNQQITLWISKGIPVNLNERTGPLGRPRAQSVARSCSCPGRSAAEAVRCRPGPRRAEFLAVPDQRCIAISAFTRVFDALWRCTASGTPSRRAEKAADGLDELGHRDRLRQIGLTAALADAFFIALHRKCGDRDHRNGLELGVLLEPFRHFETGYFRQLYIHQDQIWPVLAGEIERLDAVACGDGVIAVRFQQVVEELHVELVVLHDHHGFRHRRCSDLRCPMRCRLPPRDSRWLANRHFHAPPTLLPCKREREQPEPLARTDSAGPRSAVVPRRYGNANTYIRPARPA